MTDKRRWFHHTNQNTGYSYVVDAEGYLVTGGANLSLETAQRVVRLHNQVVDQLAELERKQENVK
jgi:hypothetical protein